MLHQIPSTSSKLSTRYRQNYATPCIDRSGEGDARTADQPSLAGAVAYLASQSPRAMTHELQVASALDNWTP